MTKTTDRYGAKEFYLEDLPRTLFPLSTNRLLVERGADNIVEHFSSAFLPQRRVYANKDAVHLRRTVKLDPIAEYFIYELVYRNRSLFRKPHTKQRMHYGYRFEQGRPIAPSISYKDFKGEVFDDTLEVSHFIGFDIASYFNNIYHHDIHAWFAAIGASEEDVEALGRFLREINAGRSLDCLPHGLYPTKMVGNDFLRLIEESSLLRSKRVRRFMDDVYLFDDNQDVLRADFLEIQKILGHKGLSVNPSKTEIGGTPKTDVADDRIQEVKKRLLQRRRQMVVSNYDIEEDAAEDEALAEDEIQFILETLTEGNLSEEDAELILIVMRRHVNRIEPYLSSFTHNFPHLAKNFYGLCAAAQDKEAVTAIVLSALSSGEHVGEYQLFWFGMMLENYLMDTARTGELITALYKHPSATDISRAKVLEIPDLRFGLPEMRDVFLREGRSDWLAWSSAAGTVKMKRGPRNHLLGYFSNGSEMNSLIAEILKLV